MRQARKFFCDSVGVLKHCKYERRMVLDPNEVDNIPFAPFMKHVQLARINCNESFLFWFMFDGFQFSGSRCAAENC